jgi:hypothetical protein
MDEMIRFSNGECFYPPRIEAEIVAAHPDISAVQIGGNGRRPRPFVLVEWKSTDISDKARLDQLTPILEDANKMCKRAVKLTPELVLFTSPAKKLVRTIKGTVSRSANEDLYTKEIERIYS